MKAAELQEVEVYVAQNGRSPFLDWLRKLGDQRARAKIRVQIDRLRLGNFGNCRSFGNSLFEAKINYGPGYRMYFGHVKQKLLLILCGGDKGSQKGDIHIAQVFWENYKRTQNEETK